MSMCVAYDGHVFRWQNVGGVSRYFQEIIARLPADWAPAMLGVPRVSRNLPKHPRLWTSTISSIRPRRLSQPIKTAWWKLRYIEGASVFHPTYYNLTGGLQYSDVKCPVVLTVHDLVNMAYPGLENDAALPLQIFQMAVARADHFVCVSKATEDDLLKYFPHVAGKTSVIYHGSSFTISSEPQSDESLMNPTFLYVGGRARYKNFLFLLRAFAKACQSNCKIRLHVVGEPLEGEERWQMHSLGILNRIDVSVFPDEENLRKLYHRSVALLYPSSHEGFGLPPLEAMACGTIPVTSNRSSLPEVMGDAGVMLDPGDESAWAECILQVAAQSISRVDLLERGRRRVRRFSWDDSAQLHVELYKRLAENGDNRC